MSTACTKTSLGTKVCSIVGCVSGGRIKRGFCGMHYQRLIRHGDPLKMVVCRNKGKICVTQECISDALIKQKCERCYFYDISIKPEIRRKRAIYYKSEERKKQRREYSRIPEVRDKILERSRSPKMKEYWRSYFKSPKGRAIAIHNSHKRRVATKETDITPDWLVELKNKTDHCEICKLELDDNLHLDHIVLLNLGGTHTKDNVRYVHALCNLTRPKDGSDITPHIV